MAEPIPDAAREPADVRIDLNSIVNPDEVAPDAGSGTSATSVMHDEIAVLEDGGPEFDAYSPQEGVGTHFLVLHPEVVNELAPDGSWVDLPTTIRRQGEGWTIDGQTFSVIFPGVLSSESPVTHNTEIGSISQVPVGAAASAGEMRTDGSLIYRDVLPSTDVVYEVAPGGFKETVVLRDAAAPTTLAWTLVVEGYGVITAADGSIQLTDADGTVLEMPPAAIIDSSKPAATSTSAYALTDAGDGTLRLSFSLDPGFVSAATYPIEIDPATATPSVLNDTYVSSSAAGSNFGGTNPLLTGAAFSGTKKYRAFLRFATAWEQSHPLVYSAELHIKNTTEGDAAAGVQVHRATWDWGNTMTWNGMMGQPNEGVGNIPDIPSGSGATNAWWTIEMKRLYQAYAYATYPDYGFRLASTDQKKFNSVEASGTSSDPYLVVSYNDLPNPPVIDGPDTKTFDTVGGVTLALSGIPTDPNGDEVLVRYQVTPTQGDWSAGDSSGWTDAKTFDVPPDWLSDGSTFFWRVQAADVCTQPDTLCDNTDGLGNTVAWPATSERNFTILAKNWGEDPRYATWSEDLGNGMAASVNEANGNLFVRVPIDRVPTPGGTLSVGLSYNSQADAEGIDRGLGSGWRLWAGPESSGMNLPVELEVLTPAPWSGVEVTYRSGRHETYGWRGGSTYAMIGAGSGVVHQNADGTWTFRTADGDVYTFDANERLASARPVSSKPSLSGGATAFSYAFNANGHLTSVTDAIGRVVGFNWADIGGTERLDTIELWQNTTHVFDLGYTGGTLATLLNPEAETLQFYDAASCGGGLMSEARNGQQSAAGTPGWRMSYVFEGQSGSQVCRVQNLYPPQATGGTRRWLFDYGANGWRGTTSLTTKITDPRGVATTSDATDYRAIVDFNYSGLPIQVVAPKLAGAAQDWITTMVWDANGNLLCSRSPQANATTGGQDRCQGANTSHEFNTEYTYDTTAPYRVLTRTDPAPSAGAARVQTTYAYDAGPTFEGLWAEIFGGPSLGGIPADEGLWQSLNQNWGTGAPAGLSNADNWSVRLSGYLRITGTQAKNVNFHVTHDDGVTVVIEDTVLMNCFGQQISGVNCGQGASLKKKLWPGLHPITIEYQEKTGSANLKVEWDTAGGQSWVVIPQTNLVPNFGLLTSTKRDPAGGGDALALETAWGYAGDDAKARRLPNFKTVTDLDPAYTGDDDAQRTEWTYDEFGRVTATTRFADKPSFAASTTKVYTDDAAAKTSCMTKLTDPMGGVTWFTCNKWGDTTEVKQAIRSVSSGGDTLQASENRITTTTYDAVGRPTRVDHPGSGATRYDYDLSGRTIQVEELIDQTPSDVWAATVYSYNDQVDPPTMTETLPDPDGGGALASPVITHTFDWVGNEVSRTDPRDSSWTWQTSYDAQNRVTSASTPDPDGNGALVPLVSTTTYSVSAFTTTNTDPAGVQTVSDLDMLGRVVRTQQESLASTYLTYDALGSLIRRERKAGSTVYRWTEFTANAFGQVTERRTPWKDGSADPVPVATDFTYNAAGRVRLIDGPRSANDQRHFEYDLAGRLVLSRYWIGASQSYDTEVIYNDAGERLQVRTQLDDSANGRWQRRRWTWTKRGQLDTYSELHDGGATYDTVNGYDVGGRLTSVDDPRTNCVISYTVDRLSRVTNQSGSSGCPGSLGFTYLADGAIDTATNALSGIVYDLDYDRAGRLTTVKKGAQTETSYAFNTYGQLSSVTDTAGITAYTYFTTGAEKGMLKTVDDPIFGAGASTYAYDAAGRMATRTDTQGGAGITWTRTYEPETSRVASQTIFKGSTQLGEFLLSFDEAGNITRRTERVGTNASDPRNGPTDYHYDAAGRLTSVTGPDPADLAGAARTWTYGYDGAGDRTSLSVGGQTFTYTLDQAGWPVGLDNATPGDPSDDTIYGWDRAGNLKTIDAPGTSADQGFTTDAWGQISGATVGATSISYDQDAFGRTLTRTEGSSTTTLAYEGITEQLATSTTLGVQTTYANTPGGPLAERVGTDPRRLYLRDLHSDVVGLVGDADSAPVVRAYYSAWGEPTWSGTVSSLGFQGQPTDPDTGLVDMTTRSYVPSLGRFASRDVLFGGYRHPLSLNQWIYGNDDPVSQWDPTGLKGGCATPTHPAEDPDDCGTANDPQTPVVPEVVPETSTAPASCWPGYVACPQEHTAIYLSCSIAVADMSLRGGYVKCPEAAEEHPVLDAAFAWGLLILIAYLTEGGSEGLGVTEGEVAQSVETWQGAEIAVAEDLGTAVNTTRLFDGSLGFSRIPDIVQRSAGGKLVAFGEVKFVAYQALTQQLADDLNFAAGKGIPFTLYVRASTVLSAPLSQAVLDGRLNLDIIPGTG